MSSKNTKQSFNVDLKDLARINAYRRIGAGLIFMALPAIEIYRRIYLDKERKIQQGEYNPKDGTLRLFSEEEKLEKFRNSWMTKIFGEK
ncbi:hypothetical protein KL905_002102 [Ogataea polymorpha]|nr:hypothetical protein KL937_001879 [Ogataea polymorpha]KAG7889823.1 hypothetical protein KL936_002497 [Ogataea polymorpha]KAG7893770.1 hypothetical protein KL908_002824 [Ogataea polymorpha]KAG7901393.1 hypothetical protein KL935_002459 [Ogataea polymorpha]KAG7905746.1 hypothetical protein KL907_002893 [Ogataea polymorpha]